jgi:hypothetical protein
VVDRDFADTRMEMDIKKAHPTKAEIQPTEIMRPRRSRKIGDVATAGKMSVRQCAAVCGSVRQCAAVCGSVILPKNPGRDWLKGPPFASACSRALVLSTKIIFGIEKKFFIVLYRIIVFC